MSRRLPRFAVPIMILVQDRPLGRFIVYPVKYWLMPVFRRPHSFGEDYEGGASEASPKSMGSTAAARHHWYRLASTVVYTLTTRNALLSE